MENEDILINNNQKNGNNIPDDLMRVKRYLSMLQRLDRITDRAFRALR